MRFGSTRPPPTPRSGGLSEALRLAVELVSFAELPAPTIYKRRSCHLALAHFERSFLRDKDYNLGYLGDFCDLKVILKT